MDKYEVILADQDGTIAQFEAWIQQRYEQENRIDRGGIWLRLAKQYYEDKLLLSIYPYPEEFNASQNHISPSLKRLTGTIILSNYTGGDANMGQMEITGLSILSIIIIAC